MSPKRARTIRRYVQFQVAIENPLYSHLGVTERSLKMAIEDARLSARARGRLFRRLKLLYQRPLAVRLDNVGELRLVGLSPERTALTKLRRRYPRPPQGGALWELSLTKFTRGILDMAGLTEVRYAVLPLG